MERIQARIVGVELDFEGLERAKSSYMRYFRQSRCLLASTTLVLFLILSLGTTHVNAQ
jgi:hypothetical protein